MIHFLTHIGNSTALKWYEFVILVFAILMMVVIANKGDNK